MMFAKNVSESLSSRKEILDNRVEKRVYLRLTVPPTLRMKP